MPRSDSRLKELADRVGETRDRLKLKKRDSALLAEVIDTLLHAEDALAAAGLFAQAVADPHNLRFAWASGQKPFDPDAALRQLGTTAEYIITAVENQLYGDEEQEDEDSGAPIMPPDIGPYYRVRTGGAEVRVESPRPMPIDDVCAAALRELEKSGFCLSPVMEVSRCADFAGPETTVFVSTKEHLEKAGLLGRGKEGGMNLSSPMKLRAYQYNALQEIDQGFGQFDRQVGVLPTGAGKTILFSKLAETRQPARTLILAHRGELISQAVDKLHSSTGIRAEVEMGEDRASLDAPVVVASVQTLMREKRRERWPRDHFGLVVVDEAHHTLADSYLNTLGHFHDHAQVLGVTATPDRGDKKNLGRYYQNIACEVTLLDLIQQAWLSPIRVKTVPLEVDLRGVRTSHGDYSADDLGHALEPYLERIADVLLEHRHRKTLVFLPLIAVSKKFAELCRERGLLAEHVDGQSSERQATLERFRKDETRILTNAMLLTEGYDEPSIDCVVCLRPTKVRALYSQIIGRGTRIWPGKDHLLVLDFLWQSGEHSLIKPAHLIAEDEEDAQAITDMLGDDGDLEEAREAVNADRTRSLAERLHENRKRRGSVLDPLELAVTLNDAHLAEFAPTMGWHADAPTTKQLDVLARFGIDGNGVLTKGHASLLLDRLIMRRKLGLATPKQVRVLRRHGHPHPETATFKEAGAFLDAKFSRTS